MRESWKLGHAADLPRCWRRGRQCLGGGSGEIKCNIRTRHRCRCPPGLACDIPATWRAFLSHSGVLAGRGQRRRESETRNVRDAISGGVGLRRGNRPERMRAREARRIETAMTMMGRRKGTYLHTLGGEWEERNGRKGIGGRGGGAGADVCLFSWFPDFTCCLLLCCCALPSQSTLSIFEKILAQQSVARHRNQVSPDRHSATYTHEKIGQARPGQPLANAGPLPFQGTNQPYA
ncbi:hypothetical protein QBC34DRAFT_34375 [Podospora aff. communis PSN243]|uniref:Uncharacterized protein n=1 Tax=Podospora aff. communis PSN243 TaxID=3040156 RepID=A0AAV9GUR2_9PEZI|nr:hypothetical protein QBC34DRAFT_34375 [Podospora aff. communis PSN243]